MSLQPDDKTPGLFVDPSRTTAGTFAVIIGVSAYPHLEGGTGERADPTYGLGQLAVSALTAHRFFGWIRELYSFTEAPIARCWVLTSPTAAEIAVEPSLADYPAATFENCKRAIQSWHGTIERMHPQYVEASRAMFFFSGHGIERADRQLLLPADYLSDGSVDFAISTANLIAGLRTLGNLADI